MLSCVSWCEASDRSEKMNCRLKNNFILAIIILSINVLVPVHPNEIVSNSSTSVKSRTKRYLIFQPGTRILVSVISFSIRITRFKTNLFEFTNSFASIRKTTSLKIIKFSLMPLGFARILIFSSQLDLNRIDWDDAKCTTRLQNWLTSTHSSWCVDSSIDCLFYRQGFDGRACILKTFCDASQEISPRTGMLFKIFKLIFTWV